jgi:hypothetical protein
MRVARGTVADELGEDPRAAFARSRQRLQNQRPSAFAANETIAASIPGAARALWLIVASAESEHGAEAADADGGDGRLGATGDHHFGVAPLHPAQRLTDGVAARRAGARMREAWATEAKSNRHLARGHVGDQGRDEIGAHLAGAALGQRQRAALQVLEAAQAHTDEHAGTVALLLREVELRLLEGHACGRHGKRDEARNLLELLPLHEHGRVEVLHLRGDPGRVLGARRK